LSTAGRYRGRSTTLVSVAPPNGVSINKKRRPFVVIDPCAGHGPGISGFKADSEIGVAMKAGHPCYFIGFLLEPMPGQTIEDIARAEAVFVEKVIALHPEADGKPCVIGNCQAGTVMIMASLRPELFWPADYRRRAVVLLGWHSRQESDALLRRPAGWELADRADQRPGRRKVRRGVACPEL